MGIGISTGLLASGGALAAFGAIAGPIGAIVGILIPLLAKIFSGCGSSCVLTSNAANQVETVLQQNLAAYLASGRTKTEQAAALANFDYAWSQLEQFCGNPQFGSAGTRCTTDRESGSCKWKKPGAVYSGCSWTPGGTVGSGNCWNWFTGYRDPIANDPCVVADTAGSLLTSAGSTISSAVSSLETVIPSNLLLIGGLILGAFLLAEVL